GSELPARANRLLDDYEARGVDVRLHPEDLDRIVHRLEGTADRLIVGMTMSALLVGISSVIAAQPGRVRVRDPLMLASGGATALLGTYLAAGAGPARRLGRLVRRGIGDAEQSRRQRSDEQRGDPVLGARSPRYVWS